jgi:hypothetical protein
LSRIDTSYPAQVQKVYTERVDIPYRGRDINILKNSGIIVDCIKGTVFVAIGGRYPWGTVTGEREKDVLRVLKPIEKTLRDYSKELKDNKKSGS